MQKAEFMDGFRSLAGRWGRKPTAEQSEIYFNVLSFIPTAAWREIIQHVIERFKQFPTPGELKDVWTEWRKSNPSRVVGGIEKSDCEECGGEGVLYGVKNDGKGYPYEPMFYCASCKNARNRKPEVDKIRVTKAQLVEWGYHLTDGNGNFLEEVPF